MVIKRSRSDAEDESVSAAHSVAAHYNSRANASVAAREHSPILHLRKLNNWIKSELINRYARPGACVLDLCCGKGGDIIKYEHAKVMRYVGIDIAAQSINDLISRWNNRDMKIEGTVGVADCFGIDFSPRLEKILGPAPFDLISCQFALHYAFATEERARRTFQNVSSLLKPGAYFIATIPDCHVLVRKLRDAKGELGFSNKKYKVSFSPENFPKDKLGHFPKSKRYGIKYNFFLEDAIDECDEYLVPFEALESLSEEHGLILDTFSNFHEFIENFGPKRKESSMGRDLWDKMKVAVNAEAGTRMSTDEWDTAYLYAVLVLRKDGTPSSNNLSSQERVSSGESKKLRHDEIILNWFQSD